MGWIPYNGNCQSNVAMLSKNITKEMIHATSSVHLTLVAIGDQRKVCCKAAYKMLKTGIARSAIPAILPPIVIKGEAEAKGVQSTDGNR